MSDDGDEIPIEPSPTDNHWLAWRWVIACFSVVVLAFAFWLGNRAPEQESRSVPAVTALDLSVQHYRAGRYEDAVASAMVALNQNPGSPEAYNNLAVSYLGLRRFDDGIAAAQEAIRLRPDFELAKNNLAWIQREKAAQASGALVPAAPVTPAAALLNQSLEHYRAGRFKECRDTAAQSAKLNPGSAAAFSNVGFCASKLQLWDEAIRNLQEAVRLDPNLPIAKNNLALVQEEKLKAEAATPR